eukprot:403338703
MHSSRKVSKLAISSFVLAASLQILQSQAQLLSASSFTQPKKQCNLSCLAQCTTEQLKQNATQVHLEILNICGTQCKCEDAMNSTAANNSSQQWQNFKDQIAPSMNASSDIYQYISATNISGIDKLIEQPSVILQGFLPGYMAPSSLSLFTQNQASTQNTVNHSTQIPTSVLLLIIFGFIFSFGYIAVMLGLTSSNSQEKLKSGNYNQSIYEQEDYESNSLQVQEEDGLSRFMRKTVQKCQKGLFQRKQERIETENQDLHSYKLMM